MGTITIGNRSLETPILVPSVSSFETQLRPRDALRLQYTLQEPISLVSAYDVSQDWDGLVPLCKTFRKQGVLLLDSGGYESSRISKYAPDAKQERWDFKKFARVASEEIYDLVFSFDYFLNENESSSAYGDRILEEFRRHAEVLDITKLIPVVHIQTLDGKRPFSDSEIAEIFGSIAAGMECQFIAVPERELGIGLPARASLTKQIAFAIRQSARDCFLHILGCGNLLTFSALAVAGAMMCDGLEWCRTLAADNFHLHHFQQKEFFVEPEYWKGKPAAEFMIEGTTLNYPTSVAVHNLLSFQAFTESLHARLEQHTVHDFVREHFGNVAGDAIRTLET
jgi:queuine/archaeosine tRNA-ribosyltransferase